MLSHGNFDVFCSFQLVMVVDARDPLFYRCPDLEVIYTFAFYVIVLK